MRKSIGYIGLGIAAACLGTYSYFAGLKSQRVNSILEPLRQDFAETAYNSDFSLYEGEDILGNPNEAIDFEGRLEETVRMRDKILEDYGCFLFGAWSVRSHDGRNLEVNTNAPVMCLGPRDNRGN